MEEQKKNDGQKSKQSISMADSKYAGNQYLSCFSSMKENVSFQMP